MSSTKSRPGTPVDKPSALTPGVVFSLDPAADKFPEEASPPLSRRDYVKNVASKIAAEPLKPVPGVWGVLTAINVNARSRKQGLDTFLNANVHYIGRLVKDTRFRIDSGLVSGEHCRIFRETSGGIFLKDTSSNGTFLNWTKLGKNSPEAEIHHGDIISFVGAPDTDHSFAFVFREVLNLSSASDDNKVSKRKANEIVPQKKRLKGIGLGAPEGPISLDDFRSLQRSNKELREQLERQVMTIDDLKSENRASVELHDKEMKGLKKTMADSYLNQIKELKDTLDIKQKELVELTKLSADQRQGIEDLNARLRASVQSCTEAGELMNSQKATVAELKSRLEEEREQRREEREKAAQELKEAVQRAHSEAQAELKRWSEAALRREKEQQEILAKLQELEKERCALLENMRSKLEDARQNLVMSENKVRQLVAQIHEEQQISAKGRIKVEDLEHEVRRLAKDLENEKAAREEACARVSTLEHEISLVIKDLDYERRRLKAARERIMLRETQLRSFYSTTEEISVMFAKQQEQLKAMQRTLEDEENYENASVEFDLNVPYDDATSNPINVERVKRTNQKPGKATSGSVSSNPKFNIDQTVSSSDEISATEAHECDDGQNTQEAEVTKGGFGSDIDIVGRPVAMLTEQAREAVDPVETEQYGDHNGPEQDGDPICTEQGDITRIELGGELLATEREDLIETEREGDPVRTEQYGDHTGPEQDGDPICTEQGDITRIELGGELLATEREDPIETEREGDPVGTERCDQYGTERVVETQSQVNDSQGNIRLNDDSMTVRDTMGLDDGCHHHSQEKALDSGQNLKGADDNDAENGDSIRTEDLFTSEVAGSWASTAPSAHGENDSQISRPGNDISSFPSNNSSGAVAENQSNPSPEAAVTKSNREREALTKMIGIVAPDMKKKLSGLMGGDGSDQEEETGGFVSHSDSDSKTESDTHDEDGKRAQGGCGSDEETEGSNQDNVDDPMDEDHDATQADSSG